jgi:TusA-related sulfurtransferase
VEERHASSLSEILKELEKRDLIELICCSEGSDDTIYRFIKPFMRETLSQMQDKGGQEK